MRESQQQTELSVRFLEMKKYQNQWYPERTEYYVAGRLFKQVQVKKFKIPNRLPTNQLDQQARNYQQKQSSSSSSSSINYAQ